VTVCHASASIRSVQMTVNAKVIRLIALSRKKWIVCVCTPRALLDTQWSFDLHGLLGPQGQCDLHGLLGPQGQCDLHGLLGPQGQCDRHEALVDMERKGGEVRISDAHAVRIMTSDYRRTVSSFPMPWPSRTSLYDS